MIIYTETELLPGRNVLSNVLFRPQSFSRGFTCACVCVCVSICAQWIKAGGIKQRALILCILLCDSEKTLRLFMAEEMMPSRINMAKSSYQLHNGQATSLRSKQHHPQKVGFCVRTPPPPPSLRFIYTLCGCVCVHFSIYLCVCLCVLEVCAWVCTEGSFNQSPVVRGGGRGGGMRRPPSLSFPLR